MTAAELSTSTGIPKSTTYHLLKTLVVEGYLTRVTESRYGLGPQLALILRLEARARQYRLVGEAVSTLSESTGVSVVIGMLNADRMVVCSFVPNRSAPRFPCWPGMELPAHASAVGKAILLQMPPADRTRYLHTHPLEPLTRKTPTTYWRLEQELSSDDDFATDDEQYQYGVSCIGRKLDVGQPAAIAAAFESTEGPRAREQIAAAVHVAAARITHALDGGIEGCPTSDLHR